ATNSIGAARVLHLDKNGKFIDQWFGNHAGQGHFSMVHGIAVNPDNGNVYIGDREEYRLVVYDARGKFIKTIQMRNLTCALYVDPHQQLWLATGQDGQIFKIDWNGNVLGAIGNGPGTGDGQFTESTYMAMDAQGNLYAGDTGAPRITMMVAARK
ncbi:MAG TPA: 6-bladed beta-propeller, partial [Gammaproteobacteria bacterium]|nr:6-bladed beta-propeller [Gammaproteobacteria bacterium]